MEADMRCVGTVVDIETRDLPPGNDGRVQTITTVYVLDGRTVDNVFWMGDAFAAPEVGTEVGYRVATSAKVRASGQAGVSFRVTSQDEGPEAAAEAPKGRARRAA